jgi:hypothetical protein
MKQHGIRTVTTRSETIVAICGKCGRKLGGGFGDGGSRSLAKALKKSLDLPKWKRSPVRLVETGCMKLCPKGAVAVTTSGDARLVYVIPAGTPVAEIAAHLGLRAQPSPASVVPADQVSLPA